MALQLPAPWLVGRRVAEDGEPVAVLGQRVGVPADQLPQFAVEPHGLPCTVEALGGEGGRDHCESRFPLGVWQPCSKQAVLGEGEERVDPQPPLDGVKRQHGLGPVGCRAGPPDNCGPPERPPPAGASRQASA